MFDELIEAGFPDEAAELRTYQRNCIPLVETENKRLTKIGGIPDLPPEIEYPTMTGYSIHWKKGRTEQYAQSAMQLVLQLDLDALAASGCDRDGLLPKTGMLWIFWAGEIFELKSCDSYDVQVEQPDKTATHRVIYWDGDRSTLRPTQPPCPYYSKYFTEPLKEVFYGFDCQPDFPGTLNYENYSDEVEEALNEVYGDCFEFQMEYCVDGDKLLGYPNGGNGNPVGDDEVMLFQFDFADGCLWNLFFNMKQTDLLNKDFSSIELDYDMD